MSNFTQNPLAKHFRQPAMYLKLPSMGRWWPEGSIDIPMTGEIPIYPMTARDEITFKTPDALMNGTSTKTVIESCCPSIKDAWDMPIVDLDPLLLSIRLATYGKEMDFVAVCPHCGETTEKTIDVTVLIDRIQPADWSQPVHASGLEITLKPQSYAEYNKSNMMNFEEQRLLQVVQDEAMPEEEKSAKFNEMFKRLIETGINQVGKSIASIKTSDGTIVTDPKFIHEFLDNCERGVWESIKDRLDAIKKSADYADVAITCTNEECNKEFIAPFVFEQTNFFG